MTIAICLGCRLLRFNENSARWECTRSQEMHVVENPGIPQGCPFYVRRKEGEKIRIAPIQTQPLVQSYEKHY